MLDDVAHSLGSGSLRTARRVTLPIIALGLGAYAALVFLAVATELTATLMLAPIDTATLATEFWSASSSVAYGAAAPYALLMVLISIPATIPLGLRHRRFLSGRMTRHEQPVHRRRDEAVRPRRGRRRRPAGGGGDLDHRGARPLGLRQDHPARLDRRPGAGRRSIRFADRVVAGVSTAWSRRRSAASATSRRRARSSRT